MVKMTTCKFTRKGVYFCHFVSYYINQIFNVRWYDFNYFYMYTFEIFRHKLYYGIGDAESSERHSKTRLSSLKFLILLSVIFYLITLIWHASMAFNAFSWLSGVTPAQHAAST